MSWKKPIQRAFSFFGKGGAAKHASPKLKEYQQKKRERFDVRDDKRYTIDSSEYSRQDFKFLELRVPELTRLGNEGAQKIRHFRELQVDGFEWFYRGAPRQKQGGEFYADFEPHSAILSMMGGTSEFRSLKGKTIRNKLTSLIATKKLNDIIYSLPVDMVNWISRAQNSGEEARNASKRLKTFRRMWKEADEAGNEEKKKQLEEMGKELAEIEEDAKEEAENFSDKAMESMAANEEAVKDALRDGLSDASETAASVEATMDSFSFGRGAGKTRKLNEEKMIEMAEAIQTDSELNRIAELAGRIKQIVTRTSQNKDRTDYGEVVDTELGGDVSRMTGPELAMLADEDFGLDLVRRLYDEQVVVWSKESRETLGRGPIVCAVDCSGSMGGERIYWAKAIACAMYQICKDRKQPFKMIQYSSSIYSRTFSHTGDDDAEFMTMLQHFEGGGTYYDYAWAEIIKTFADEKEMHKADVIFISDECFPVGQYLNEVKQFNNALKDASAQCFGISVGMGTYYNDDDTLSAFKHFCHSAWKVKMTNTGSIGGDEECISELFVDNLDA